VSLNNGSGSNTCAGALAQTTFTWAVCSCKNIAFQDGFLIDGWNSLQGPYTPGQLGGGAGANVEISSQSSGDIWGQAWAASTATAFSASMNVHHDLQSGGNISADGLNVSRDAHVAGNISGDMSIAQTLYQPAGKSSGGASYGMLVNQPVTVPPPCDCTDTIPVGAMVAYAKTNNDDAAVGLDPALLTTASHPPRIDLPCGQYYLTGFSLSGDVTIVAHGNTAIFVDGDINANANLTITIADATSQLDLFVSGTIVATSEARIGNPNFPALTRIYIGGTQTLDMQSSLIVGGEIWAGNAKVLWESEADMFGAIFAGDFSALSQFNLHADEGVLQVGSSCTPPGGGGPAGGGEGGTTGGGEGGTTGGGEGGTTGGGGGGTTCGSCRDCGNQACVNGACGSCTSSADCCAPLVCASGTCVAPYIPK
jgi:hypothetical protein